MMFDNAEKRVAKTREKMEKLQRLHAEAQEVQSAAAAALHERQEELADADDPVPVVREALTSLADANELLSLRERAVAKAEHELAEAEAALVEERQLESVEAYRAAAKSLAAALGKASKANERLREIRAQAPRPSELTELAWNELRPEGSKLTLWREQLDRFTNPPPPPKTETVSVRFLTAFHGSKALLLGPGYNAGELAGFPPDVAARLVSEGIAERL